MSDSRISEATASGVDDRDARNRAAAIASQDEGIISATPILHPRRERIYHSHLCGKSMGRHVRLYGAAHPGDRPYVMRICPECAGNSIEGTKINLAFRAIEAANEITRRQAAPKPTGSVSVTDNGEGGER